MRYVNQFLLIFLSLATYTNSAKILLYFGLAGQSHVISLWPLVVELADRGHDVTFLTSFAPKVNHSKVNVIHSEEMFRVMNDVWDEGADLVRDRMNGEQKNVWSKVPGLSLKICSAMLDDPRMHGVLFQSQFDLVIVDGSGNECGFALAYYQYKCPYISYSSLPFFPTNYDDFGLPPESSHIPDVQEAFGTPMTFSHRLLSTLQPISWWFYHHFTYYPALAQILKDKLNLSETPDIGAAMRKTGLVLHNTHHSRDYVRAKSPLFVDVAGMHIPQRQNPLPKELEDFVSAPETEGFIYVSFGTTTRISKSHDELREKLFRTIGNFSRWQFVWKWEDNIPSAGSYPPNIYFADWLPQIDLFAHPRIRGFVGHGGSNGIHEAVHFGVPMLVFPIFGDQDYNANSLAAKRLAVVMEISKFTQQELTTNLETVLFDEAFHKRVARARRLFRDRPMKPLATALWWVEYVLRHATNELMSRGVSQTWYERRLLDVWAFCFLVAGLALGAVACLVWTCWTIEVRRRTTSRKHSSASTSKTKIT